MTRRDPAIRRRAPGAPRTPCARHRATARHRPATRRRRPGRQRTLGLRPLIPAAVRADIEAYHGRIRRDAWQWMLSRLVVAPITQEIANEAINLLQDAGLHGHKYAIDAALAAVALREPGDITIFTSDEDGMRQLCGDRVVVVKI